ncbi:MAG: hypothetical protein A2X64_08405 [Ignavibacteria bacterium GWF2_33_9]|nr:MAG: hypothetical protein A2X64_08405 [Ignavibacteria bacterium GWF2_33_9]
MKILSYDQKGSLICILTNMEYESGIHTLMWETNKILTGVYLCEMKTKNEIKTVKIVVGK